MIRFGLLLAVAGSIALVLVTDAAPGDDAKKVTKKVNGKLVGAWKVVSAETNGKTVGEGGIKATKWVITEATFTARLPQEGKGEFAYKLGEADMRGTIDIEVLSSERVTLGPARRLYAGIYALEGDELKICYAPGKERPTAYATEPGSGSALFVLKREPASEKKRR
jgi:uncharacterized protein (TIGR03067 family)